MDISPDTETKGNSVSSRPLIDRVSSETDCIFTDWLVSIGKLNRLAMIIDKQLRDNFSYNTEGQVMKGEIP